MKCSKKKKAEYLPTSSQNYSPPISIIYYQMGGIKNKTTGTCKKITLLKNKKI